MTLGGRLAALTAAAVAIAVALACVLVYVDTRGALLRQADGSLSHRARDLVRLGAANVPLDRFPDRITPPPTRPGQVETYLTVLGPDGRVHDRRGAPRLPVPAVSRAVAAGRRRSATFEATVAGDRVRILTVRLPRGGALEIGRSLGELDRLLRRLRIILAAVTLAGVALGFAAGRLVARRALAPVRRLSQATDYVTRTRDLGRRLDVGGRDEVSRLAVNFNAMLDALQHSMEAQRQLVADASHELRTPVTSLRTNAEVLRDAGDRLDPGRRRGLLEAVVRQSEELTGLMDDVIALARGERDRAEPEDVRLDRLVGERVERARRHAPATEFVADLEPVTVRGVPERLARAVDNLLANASAWNRPGRPVEVALHGGTLTVRDHGAGIPEAERALVFDRFFRGVAARSRPGSGLGLAIVRQVVEAHEGEVAVEAPDGGGTTMVVRLPAG